MSDAAPHPTPRRTGAGALVLTLLAGLLVVLAALTLMLVLPLIVVLTAMGESGTGGWPVYLWAALVFAAGFWSVVTGLRMIDDPRRGPIVLLAGVAILAFFSFPPFWYAGP